MDRGAADASEKIKLPAPEIVDAMPLMEALQARRSTREFSGQALPLQVLSNLLWAANGVNRPETGQRTAPSAHDWREIDVYAATAAGVHRYLPDTHALALVVSADLRAQTAVQEFAAVAPLNLVYVADTVRMEGATPADRVFYGATDAGFIAQNVYLYAASAGLAVVVRGLIPRAALAAALKLDAEEHVILAQTVGYPAR